MANRNFASGGKMYSMHVMPVMLNVNITIGATGAVASITGPTIKSVVRTGTGLYTINLQDPYNRVLAITGGAQSPVSGLSGVSAIEAANAPSTSVASKTAPSVSIKTLSAAGALVDPAVGSVISVVMLMNNSSVKA